MSPIPIPPSPRAGSSSPSVPLVLDSVVVRRVRLEHAAAGATDEPITFLAAVELEGALRISALRVVLAEPTRIAIDWPEPLRVRDVDGVDHAAVLLERARDEIRAALVRHLVHGDLAGMLP